MKPLVTPAKLKKAFSGISIALLLSACGQGSNSNSVNANGVNGVSVGALNQMSSKQTQSFSVHFDRVDSAGVIYAGAGLSACSINNCGSGQPSVIGYDIYGDGSLKQGLLLATGLNVSIALLPDPQASACANLADDAHLHNKQFDISGEALIVPSEGSANTGIGNSGGGTAAAFRAASPINLTSPPEFEDNNVTVEFTRIDSCAEGDPVTMPPPPSPVPNPGMPTVP